MFRIVSKDGDRQHRVTDVQGMDESKSKDLAKKSWNIEEYHRGIKQSHGVEKCPARKEESQKAHIMFSLRVFLRLELQRVKSGISWFEIAIKIRTVWVKAYLNDPLYTLN